MNSGNSVLTLMALVLFSTILVGFYGGLARSSDVVNNAQSGIAELTYATTYMELANGLAFDEETVDSLITTAQISLLTAPGSLGKENPPPAGEPTEANFATFDDIDDLNNYSITDSSLAGIEGVFKTNFKVYYVAPTDLGTLSASRTFVKRVDMAVIRLSPPSTDTLYHSFIIGYFHFD